MGTRAEGSRTRLDRHRLATIGLAGLLCIAFVGIGTLPAYAHHPMVSSNVVCNSQTQTYDVTWTVANGNWEGRTMTLDQSTRAAVPLSSYAPDETKTYTESLPGTTLGTTTLTVRGDWNNGGPQNVQASTSVETDGSCEPEPEIKKHTICHATNSTTNPYSGHEDTINPSGSGVLNGHLDHTGPVPTSQADLEQMKDDHIQWGDIIPPFEWDGQTYSLNWTDAGQAIFDNGCAVPQPEPEPDLSIEKDADDSSVHAGDEIGYTVTVSNEGDGEAEDVQLTDQLPANPGLDWEIEDTTGGWDCQIGGGVLTCGGQGFDLGAGEWASVHITSPTTVGTCGTVSNQASASLGTDGQEVSVLTTGDDEVTSDVVTITVECTPAIQILKGGPALVHVDDTITYTFEVTNTGELELFDVVLSDPICDQGSIVAGADVDASLAVGEVWHFTCTHLVTAGDPDPLPNTATISGDTSEGEGGQPVSDTDDHVVDIIHPAISIVKTVDEEVVPIGTTVTFTYVVANTGDTTLYDISVDDDILGHVGDIQILEPGDQVTLTKDFVVGTGRRPTPPSRRRSPPRAGAGPPNRTPPLRVAGALPQGVVHNHLGHRRDRQSSQEVQDSVGESDHQLMDDAGRSRDRSPTTPSRSTPVAPRCPVRRRNREPTPSRG
jgi:uncharacterized repeat protein (TIGR01451 family)